MGSCALRRIRSAVSHALLAKIKAGVADRYTMGRVRKCAADCARASGTKAARFFDAAAKSVARATIFG